MDDCVLEFVKSALDLRQANYIKVQYVRTQSCYGNPGSDEIWLRDDRRAVGPRWCIIVVEGTALIIDNGRQLKCICDLKQPDSVESLGLQIISALNTTALFVNSE